ncbi:MAG: apolipoprotein N-acyltransferase, partial [Candidatus Binatia bacterium]
ALLCLLLHVAGSWRLADVRHAERSLRLRVGLVQPAIDPVAKWDPGRRAAVIDAEEALSRQAAARGAELVIWPEASAPYVFAGDSFYDAVPGSFTVDRALRDRMIGFVRSLGAPLLFGSPAVEVRTLPYGEIWNSKNRAFLLSPEGRIEGQYDKMILVPFGEYVPGGSVLWFVEKLVPGVGNFLPGSEPTIFRLGDARFAVLICYEAIFPDFVRRFVDRGAAFLVNQTNDAWFGDTAAPLQHLDMAIVRAVENRVPLVRVANTGISAVVDVDGRITAQMPLFAPGSEVIEIGVRDGTTFYTRHGDVFALTAALAAVLFLLYAGWMPGKVVAIGVRA